MACKTFVNEETGTVSHLCAPSASYYVARVRPAGYRKYSCGPRRKRLATAMRDMLRLFENTLDAKRADVLATYEWYEPSQVCELVKR